MKQLYLKLQVEPQEQGSFRRSCTYTGLQPGPHSGEGVQLSPQSRCKGCLGGAGPRVCSARHHVHPTSSSHWDTDACHTQGLGSMDVVDRQASLWPRAQQSLNCTTEHSC